ncbi:MAG: acyltransferase [Lachnospiraceae bacterium]|nr:acyltransferase [Lachnospiraceae bacterium]
MANLLLLLFPIAIFVLLFYKAKLAPKGTFSESYLSHDQMMAIRTFACLSIILHHLTQRITSYGSKPAGPITIYNYIGFLCTAIFFFSSGYGLLFSFTHKESYLKGFLRKRLPAVLVPFILVNLLTILVLRHFHVPGTKSGVATTLKQILGLELLDGNGWYIVEIVVLYVVFAILFSKIKNKDVALALTILFTLALIAFSFLRGHDFDDQKETYFMGEWWYNSTITFAFGLLYARLKEQIEKSFRKHYKIFLGVFLVLTPAWTYLGIQVCNRFGYYHEMLPTYHRDALISLIVQSLNCIIVVTFLLLLNLKISLGNKALTYMGSIQLMLFLVHGFFVQAVFWLLDTKHFYQYLAVFLPSLAVAALLSPLARFLIQKVQWILLHIHIKPLGNKTLTRLAKVLVLAVILFFLGRSVYGNLQAESEMKTLRSCKAGDTVYYGHFDIDGAKPGKERVEWLVLRADAKQVYLITKDGIACDYMNQKHEEISWGNCDLRTRLNSKEFTGMFSEKEWAKVLPKNGDCISLLTAGEAANFFATPKDRELHVTDVAIAQGCNINTLSKANNWDNKGYRSSWWWLKGDFGKKAITAPIVTVDGEISLTERYVNKPGGAIRPVILVDISAQ